MDSDTVALYIDTLDKELPVYTVSATLVHTPACKGLVLRMGMLLGSLPSFFSEGQSPLAVEYPILINQEGHSLPCGKYACVNGKASPTELIAIQGFPFQRKQRLTLLRNPFPLYALSSPATVTSLETQVKGWDSHPIHRNKDTAQAALAGIALAQRLRPSSLFLSVGSSTHTGGWRFDSENAEKPLFPDEYPQSAARRSLAMKALLEKGGDWEIEEDGNDICLTFSYDSRKGHISLSRTFLQEYGRLSDRAGINFGHILLAAYQGSSQDSEYESLWGCLETVFPEDILDYAFDAAGWD